MKDVSIDYDYILSKLSTPDIEGIIRFLWEMLPGEWCEKYRKMTPAVTNILQFNDNGFEFLFDFSSELITKGVVSCDEAVEDRVVAVFGRSQPSSRNRDANRMKGFLGSSSKVFGDDYDKGHFIGHALGGGLDVNLFPQRRDINRGWSARGKIFRAMERYCSESPGTFCFSRPIYCDRSWRPCIIEYGLLTKVGTFWVEKLEN
ncbi:MAG TPA: hypothetical protein ENI60_00440 [Candidatus Fraserbacteria bacterium]|nr:hypothetical protein [Candidatus Fraserbacteria bacterium]